MHLREKENSISLMEIGWKKKWNRVRGKRKINMDDGRPEQTVFGIASKDAKWLVLIKGGWAE